MVCQRSGKSRRIPKRLVIIALLISIGAVLLQAQEEIPLLIEPEDISEGENFSLTMYLPMGESEDVSISEPDFPDIVYLISGPSIRPAVVTNDDGTRSTKLEVSYRFRARSGGRRPVGSFIIRRDGGITTSYPEVIEIASANTGMVPFDVEWRLSNDEVYVGQVVSLILEIKNISEIIAFPESIELATPSGGVFEEVKGLGVIEKNQYGDTFLYSVPVAAYFFTPGRQGRFTIPGARVSAAGITASSAAVIVEAAELPAEAVSSGAVGDYSYTVALDKSEVLLEEAVVVSMRVEGEGNLHFFQFPDPEFENLSLADEIENSSYKAAGLGYRGYREKLYVLSPKEAGRHRISVPDFVWVDLNSGRIRRGAGRDFSITVKAAAEEAESDLEKPAVSIFSLEQIKKVHPLSAYRKPVFYLLLLPGLLLLLIVFIKYRLTRVSAIAAAVILLLAISIFVEFPEEKIQSGISHFKAGEYENALSDFESADTILPDSPAVVYNMGVCHYMLENRARAVFLMRKAVRLNPMVTEFKTVLLDIERYFSLNDQVSPPLNLAPDMFFFLSLFAFNLLALITALSIKRRKGIFVIFSILSFFFLIASVSGLFWTLGQQDADIGIVAGTPAQLKKIPEMQAEDWISLDEGTAVSVLVDEADFFLIRTSYGIEGWIARDNLLRVADEETEP